ncbi:ATP-dependent DNA helicase [uncultured Corynebacterium sp.]|uniref:ATP-dependent helicase n=1 Tax=uncultured Corynebacterium sp. TaxID=159447 RepID=UPI0025D00C71|nr:ATP-dependent DNA helicase [uncultured Corynebacterium sp.]
MNDERDRGRDQLPSDIRVGMPAVRLTEPEAAESRTWEGAAAALFPGDDRLADLKVPGAAWQVVGGPGTGKSALLVDLAAAHVAAGWPADSVQVLAPSKEAAGRLRDDVARRLPPSAGAGSGGMVRAVHSLAFALVRSAAVRAGRPEPSLATGARQDAVIRELLRGHADAGGAYWPERLVPALRLKGMARQLRDLLLRAAERGAGPERLEELGQAHGIAEWVAAGKFLREYRRVMRLAWHEELNAAELVSAAVAAVDADPSLIAEAGIRVLLIDDAEHLDPQSAELVRRLLPGVELAVVTGDHDQSVLRFRGADSTFLDTVADPERRIVLHSSRRCTPEVAIAANRVSSRLPGRPPERGIRGTRVDGERPAARVVVHDSGMGEKASIADFLRRTHLEGGVAWKDMAVLVRSGAGESALHRFLARAGVPVRMDPTDVILGEQRMVAALVLVLRAVDEGLDPSEWERLLTGPLGNADPVALTRLVRGVRRVDLGGARAMDRIVGLLSAEQRSEAQEELIAGLPERERDVLAGPLRILDAGRAARAEGVEAVAWAVWEASGLADHLMAASLRGGAAGSAADRDLDGIMTFFDFLGDLVEGDPGATIGTVVREIAAHELPTGARDRRGADREAVVVLSAHAALGREWEAVAVAGVQEDAWPSLGRTGSVVSQQELVDLLDEGIDPSTPVSHAAERLAEERRLFHVAISRARRHLLVTAVDAPDDEGAPSRFLRELGEPIELRSAAGVDGGGAGAGGAVRDGEAPGVEGGDEAGDAVGGDAGAPDSQFHDHVTRVLSMGSLLAELRAAVLSDAAGPVRREQAARQLARLAEAGVPGADPADWWGLAEPSTDDPVVTGPVRVSPSKVGKVMECPLRALLEQPSTSAQMALGTAFHRVAEALEDGVAVDDATQSMVRALPELVDEPRWRVEAIERDWSEAVSSWAGWTAGSTAVGTEIDVRVPVTDDVVLTGRIDRLEEHPDGGYVVVDAKTGATPPSAKDVEDNPQLATYQLALSEGQLTADGVVGGDGLELGGAKLVFPRKTGAAGPAVRTQSARTPEQLEQWRERVLDVAADMRGPGAAATPGAHCDHCRVRLACPAKEGRR